jgi:tRNA G37 N-methylase TrmD
MSVPDVLTSGDHKAVARWRLDHAKVLTAKKAGHGSANTNELPNCPNSQPTGSPGPHEP